MSKRRGTLPRIVNEPGRVILRGDVGLAVALSDVVHSDVDLSEFGELFTVSPRPLLANPAEPFCEEVDLVSVIARKSDGALFGFAYSTEIRGGGTYLYPNGPSFGVGPQVDESHPDATFVFAPVEAFTVTGYRPVSH